MTLIFIASFVATLGVLIKLTLTLLGAATAIATFFALLAFMFAVSLEGSRHSTA